MNACYRASSVMYGYRKPMFIDSIHRNSLFNSIFFILDFKIELLGVYCLVEQFELTYSYCYLFDLSNKLSLALL